MSLAYVVMRTDAPTNAPGMVFTTVEALRAYIGTDATPGTSASIDPATLKGKIKYTRADGTRFDADRPFTVYTVLLDPSPPEPTVYRPGMGGRRTRRRRRTTRKH